MGGGYKKKAGPASDCQAGFTLIELLVSMFVLTIIVLVVARLFQQSATAWESGSRKAETSMIGRTLADFMAQEISQAVQDEVFFPNRFNVGGGSIRFVALQQATPTNRAARLIEYRLQGNAVWRSVSDYVSSNSFGAARTSTMAEDVEDLQFDAGPMGPAGVLPRYVDVTVTTLSEGDREKGLDRRQAFRSRAYIVHEGRYRWD